jgi:starvation-inducible DNA-binding protein
VVGLDETLETYTSLDAALIVIIAKVRDAITRTATNRDDGTNDPLMSDVLRRHELQVWFLAEHLVHTPAVDA